MERMQKILFRPFNFAKWMAIGFCSWLAGLAGANLNFNQFHHGEKSHFGEMFAHSWIYIHQNLSWIIPLSIVFAIVGMALVVALLWLSSRGQFMFLHCVVLNRGEISLPWKKFSKEATSLWHLRLILCAFSLVNVLVFVGVIVWSLLRFPNLPPHVSLSLIAALTPVGLVFFGACLLLVVIGLLSNHFVVPIMYLRRVSWVDGWNVLLGLIHENAVHFLLYLLFQIVLTFVIGFLVLIAVLCTCCLGGLLLLIPFAGAVVLLPISVFKRSYPLYYLAQYGSEFDLFQPPD